MLQTSALILQTATYYCAYVSSPIEVNGMLHVCKVTYVHVCLQDGDLCYQYCNNE